MQDWGHMIGHNCFLSSLSLKTILLHNRKQCIAVNATVPNILMNHRDLSKKNAIIIKCEDLTRKS